ncbi:MAG TPA: sigma-70 family RNA polymerase sigma factor [Candidatus Acidoferrum sp.]|nr:sigma-70 family RNA polymerase sigma factor [Candidatus Acidoferrum sp.]
MSDLLTAKKDREFELIDRILGGHHEGFYELISPYEHRVFMTAYDILQVEADAEEVAQEAFLKAFRSLRSFRREAQFSTWLLRITVNEARMRLRKRREISLDSVFPNHEEGDYTPILLVDWREIPAEALLREETRRLLRESLAALPENYREIITLRDVNGLSNAETAEILGLTLGNTKVRLLRARITLRDLFVERLRGKTRHRPAREVTP